MKRALRAILEKLSRGVVLKRKLPARFGSLTMLVTPASSLCYWKAFFGNAWNDLFRFADKHVRKGDIVWDVGANLGVFSICAAFRTGPGGKVFAFEPDPVTAGLIQKTKELNPGILDHLEVIQKGVSNQEGFSVLNIPERARACSHLQEAFGGAGVEMTGKIIQKIPVHTTTLDKQMMEKGLPDVLKIDVDGSEHLVLQGGEALFRATSPVLLIEVHDRNQKGVTEFLSCRGYSLFNYDDPSLERPAIGKTAYNTLALPKKIERP